MPGAPFTPAHLPDPRIVVRRLLLVLLLLSSVTAVLEGALPCDVVDVAPECHVVLRPGPANDVLPLVEIVGVDTSESSGQLVLTTVSVQQDVSLFELWRLADDPTTRRADRELYFPEDVDEEVTREQFAAMMTESELTATVAALRHLGYDLDPTGVRVAGVMDDGPAAGVVAEDDVIVGLDGTRVEDVDMLLAELETRSPGDTVTFEVEQGGDPGQLVEREVTLGANPDDPGRALIGVFVTTRIDIPVDVQIDAGNIGGPSAGLMFALTIVDLLSEEDLTGGMVVAGTGEITSEGRVGPIGGIQQKIPGSVLRGEEPPAEVFLVPRDNVEEARGAAVSQPLTLVPVDTLADAVAALEALRAGDQPDGAFTLSPSTSVADS